MELKADKILITGGSSGIGLELAKQLSEKGNKIIICGRSDQKLEQAKKEIPSISAYKCDLSKISECEELFKNIKTEHPDCNILINNAAIVHKTKFETDKDMIQKAELEIRANYLAPVVLTKLFLPFFTNKKSAVIFITTGLVYSPKAAYPVYSSTKAGLHSFVQTLRLQLNNNPIEIIEALMPAVDTPFHQGEAPKIAISAEKAVNEMLKGLEKGKKEIRIAGVKMLYYVSRLAPKFTFKKINEF